MAMAEAILASICIVVAILALIILMFIVFGLSTAAGGILACLFVIGLCVGGLVALGN